MPVLAMLSVLLKADSKMCFGRPHRLKPVDCKFITKLAKLVPVIPVLAKADSMTAPELTSFRHTVSQSLLKVRCRSCSSSLAPAVSCCKQARRRGVACCARCLPPLQRGPY